MTLSMFISSQETSGKYNWRACMGWVPFVHLVFTEKKKIALIKLV